MDQALAGIMVIFHGFGNGLQALGLISLVFAALEYKLGIVLIPGMDPLEEQLEIIGGIGITLAGAYPLIAVVKGVLAPVWKMLGKFLGIGDVAVTGMVACLASSFLLFDMLKDMDKKGKTVAMAFAVPDMSILGAHLGYVSAAMPKGGVPMVAAKLAAGFTAVLLAECFSVMITKREK